MCELNSDCHNILYYLKEEEKMGEHFQTAISSNHIVDIAFKVCSRGKIKNKTVQCTSNAD